MTSHLSAKERLIFALDVGDAGSALDLVRALKGHVGVFKVGLELYSALGPSLVEAIRDEAGECGIFLDLKFHDIPATVAGAVRSTSEMGVEFLTIHSGESPEMVRAAMGEASYRTRVLCVTVLTSISAEELKTAGYSGDLADPASLVMHKARMAREAGAMGFVCSPLEVKAMRSEFGPEVTLVVPGIRAADSSTDDQKRVATPYDAIMNGADFLVIGRPIRKAPDPAAAADAIVAEIDKAIKDRG